MHLQAHQKNRVEVPGERDERMAGIALQMGTTEQGRRPAVVWVYERRRPI